MHSAAPPRAARRGVVEYWRAEGTRALLARMVQELAQRERRLARVARRVVLLGHLDLPAADSWETTSVLRVVGWAWSQSGIESVRMFIDGDLVATTTTGLTRSDVDPSMTWGEGIITSGFSADVKIPSLPDGEHELAVVITDGRKRSRRLTRIFSRIAGHKLYHAYHEAALPSEAEVAEAMAAASAGPGAPRFVAMIDGDRDGDLAGTLASLAAQRYDALDVVIVASAGRQAWVRERSEGGPDGAPSVVIAERLTWPSGPDDGRFRLFLTLRPGEQLSRGALWLFAARAVTSHADVIYSDHDVVLWSGRHVDPAFKPDWSLDHLLSRDYVGVSYVVRDGPTVRAIVEETFRVPGHGSPYELLLRITDGPAKVDHLPRVLWSLPEGAAASPEQLADARSTVERALERRGAPATVRDTDRPGVRHVRWATTAQPKVSIIIPTTGRIDHLRPCLDSLKARTAYPDVEVLVIDNGRGRHRDGIRYALDAGFRVLTRDEPFNWAKLNNDGVRETDGAIVLFLNDDIVIVDEDWLTEMVGLAARPDVGTVGAMLLYPDGRIQHAGVVLADHGGGAMHLMQGLDPTRPLYADLQAVTREVSASTGACLAMRREVFQELGGFDESLAVVGNDLDLCLRAIARGYRNLWTPHASLVHHESVSRAAIAIEDDESSVRVRWGDVLQADDPYSNPNLDRRRTDCAIDWSRVRVPPAPKATALAPGVNVIGYIRAEMGVGEGARGHAHALTRAGVPFVLVDHSAGNPARMGDESWLHKLSEHAPYDTNLVHVNADHITEVLAALPAEHVKGRYTIGFWAWELPELPDAWLGAFEAVDEVWTPSTFVRESIAAKSPVPVVHMPHAIRLPAGPFLERSHFGLDAAPFQFLTMYDVHSIRQRKNPDGAVQAFRDAFRADDASVTLVIKINGGGGSESETIERWTDGYPNIRVIDRTLDRHEVDSLLATSDAFVSLHRSEGFGIPIAEAMGLAKPVIATHWSGNADFMSPDNSGCVRYDLVTLERDYGPYPAGQRWAEPDLADAATWMRRIRDDAALRARLAANARATVTSMFSGSVVGARIATRLAELRAEGRIPAARRRAS